MRRFMARPGSDWSATTLIATVGLLSIVAVTTTGNAADLAEFGPDVTIGPAVSLARATADAALGREVGDWSW